MARLRLVNLTKCFDDVVAVDTHIPPGWGTIPYRDALHQLGEYHGLLVLEINERFRAYYPEALETVKRLLRKATQAFPESRSVAYENENEMV